MTQEMRKILAMGWNSYVNSSTTISVRRAARLHNLAYATWQRELKRGATGPIVRKGRLWAYPEYEARQTMASINEGRGNMGARMKLTASMARLFRHAVLELKRSPYDARMMIVEAFPDRDVPCLKTFYNHIEAGYMGVFHGNTPYHPGRKRKPREPAHEARTVPGRRQLKDRSKDASDAKTPGHWEMDTVLSRKGAKGGLLVMLDRCSRRYVIERIDFINQDEVAKAA